MSTPKLKELDEADKLKVVELYQTGMSIDAVRKAVGCSRRQVIATLRSEGVSTERTKPESKLVELQALALKGHTAPEAAKIMGVSADYVRKLSRWYGVKLKAASAGAKPKPVGTRLTITKPCDTKPYNNTPPEVTQALRGYGW